MTTNERATLFTAYEQMKRAHDTLMSMDPTPDRDRFSTHLQQPIIFLQQSLQLTQAEIDKPAPPTRLHTLGRIRDCCKTHINVNTLREDDDCQCEMIAILTKYIGDEEMAEKVQARPSIDYESTETE